MPAATLSPAKLSAVYPPLTELQAHNALPGFNLTASEYALIDAGMQQALGRAPNMNELAMFSVLWSEHCCYKHSKHLLKTLPTEGERILQGPGENAGVVSLGKDSTGETLGLAFKIESHNHPTAIEPHQGAATGVGGILRDIFTMNARPIASLNALRFGSLQPNETTTEAQAARNRYLLRHAVEGIAHYGNCVGVPTIGGEISLDARYNGNPLVNAMAIGLVYGDTLMQSGMPADAAGIGNPVIYVGSDTGKDGMGGAAFASKELDESSADDRPAVQVGDPFLEKLLIEACLEAFATGYVVSAQDMGAAGLTCSGAEMSAKNNLGMTIDLDKVPAREPGMLPHEYLLSESQERMLFVVARGHEADVMAIFEKWDLAASVVGTVVAEPVLTFTHQGEVVAQVPPRLLTDDAPLYEEALSPPEPETLRARREKNWDDAAWPDIQPNEVGHWLKTLLGHPNMANPSPIYQQYDRHVRNNTRLSSETNTSGVIRIRDKQGKPTGKAIAATVDGRSWDVLLNPHAGAAGTVAEAARNLVCVGAEPLAVTNNLNFGDPEKPDNYYHMAMAVKGMGQACVAFNTPVTGGNVSLYNEHGGAPILPSPVIGMVGLLEDDAQTCGASFTQPGDVIALLGGFNPGLGASQYQLARCGTVFGEPPAVDLAMEKALQALMLTGHHGAWWHSATDVSLGGLAVTVAEGCMPTSLTSAKHPVLGASIDVAVLDTNDRRLDTLLFGETHGAIVVSFSPEKHAAVEAACQAAGVGCTVLGTVTESPTLTLSKGDTSLVSADMTELFNVWSTAFGHALERTH